MLSEKDIIEVVPSQADYVARFQAEATLLHALLATVSPQFHHVGSTAVPGLAAKPIIDISAEITPFPLPLRLLVALQANGYLFWADNPATDFQLFIKGMPRTHHLHLYPAHSQLLADKLLFRNYLCRHPAEAEAYQQLKQELAQQFRVDREAYTAGKTEFIQQAMRRAKADH